MDEFDFIVVGAGSSGCALAARLSEDPANRVCLVEAGPEDRSPLIKVPLGVMRLLDHPKYNWRFKTVPQEHAKGRQIPVPRGKTLGGSSAINGMIYTRGHPTDYDDWANRGNPGWSYREVLPYFKRSENNEDFPDSPYHGRGGPLNVTFLDKYNPLAEIFFQAGESLQHRRNPDFCGATHEGFGRRQVTMKNGRRWSASSAYLKPALKRPNLTVMSSARVHRVIIEGGRALGIAVERGGAVETVRARREVLLCAGAVGSPHLLMLSGVGDAVELSAHGIEVRKHLPGVGENWQDHITTAVQWESPSDLSYGLTWKTAPSILWELMTYPLTGRGLLANNILHAGAFIRSLPGLARPDLQFILIPAFRDAKGRLGRRHGFAIMPFVLRPVSRGKLSLASADPRAAPVIDPKFFSAEEDLETLVRGVKLARRLVDTPPFAPHRGPESGPNAGAETEQQIREFIRSTAYTAYHPVGACSMGPGPMDVVDAELKVHGIEALRVVDTSAMPTLIGGNTNGPAIMMAEKAADMILGRAPPAPENVPIA